MPLPPFTAIVSDLPETVPFVGPEALERRSGIAVRARLGANESAFGPSPLALTAMREEASKSWAYPDPENHALRVALATKLGIAADEIAIGEGADGLMGLAVRLFIAPGDVVVTSLGAYPTFNYHVAGYGGRLEYVPYQGVNEDLDGLLAAVLRTGAKMVYLANPDNPMGSFWPAAAVERFIAALPEACVLVLDEAYGELAPDDGLPPIDTARANVLRLRSFSKAYGMAGMRCGYAIGHRQVIGAFNRVRNHFGVNRLVQAGALAALNDEAYLDWVKSQIAASRQRIANISTANRLIPLPSATNFVTIDCGRDGAYAQKVLEELGKLGVFIRKPMAPGLDKHIRISAAPEAEMAILEATLPIALRAAQGAA
jgi:histidinol-phosphate aminotransferase